jgi:hypothetical protein
LAAAPLVPAPLVPAPLVPAPLVLAPLVLAPLDEVLQRQVAPPGSVVPGAARRRRALRSAVSREDDLPEAVQALEH